MSQRRCWPLEGHKIYYRRRSRRLVVRHEMLPTARSRGIPIRRSAPTVRLRCRAGLRVRARGGRCPVSGPITNSFSAAAGSPGLPRPPSPGIAPTESPAFSSVAIPPTRSPTTEGSTTRAVHPPEAPRAGARSVVVNIRACVRAVHVSERRAREIDPRDVHVELVSGPGPERRMLGEPASGRRTAHAPATRNRRPLYVASEECRRDIWTQVLRPSDCDAVDHDPPSAAPPRFMELSSCPRRLEDRIRGRSTGTDGAAVPRRSCPRADGATRSAGGRERQGDAPSGRNSGVSRRRSCRRATCCSSARGREGHGRAGPSTSWQP